MRLHLAVVAVFGSTTLAVEAPGSHRLHQRFQLPRTTSRHRRLLFLAGGGGDSTPVVFEEPERCIEALLAESESVEQLLRASSKIGALRNSIDLHLRISYAEVADAELACDALHRLASFEELDEDALVGERRVAQLVETVSCRATEVDAMRATRTVWALSVLGVGDRQLLGDLEHAIIRGLLQEEEEEDEATYYSIAAAGARAFACASAAVGYRATKLHAAIDESLRRRHISRSRVKKTKKKKRKTMPLDEVAPLISSLACLSFAIDDLIDDDQEQDDDGASRALVRGLATTVVEASPEAIAELPVGDLAACVWSFAHLLDSEQHDKKIDPLFATLARACAARRGELLADERYTARVAWGLSRRGEALEAANVIESYLDWLEKGEEVKSEDDGEEPAPFVELCSPAEVVALSSAMAMATPESPRARNWVRLATIRASSSADYGNRALARLALSCASLETSDNRGPAWLWASNSEEEADVTASRLGRALGELFARLDEARHDLGAPSLARAAWASALLGAGGVCAEALCRAAEDSLEKKKKKKKQETPSVAELGGLCWAMSALLAGEEHHVLMAAPKLAVRVKEAVRFNALTALAAPKHLARTLASAARLGSGVGYLRFCDLTPARLDAALSLDPKAGLALLSALSSDDSSSDDEEHGIIPGKEEEEDQQPSPANVVAAAAALLQASLSSAAAAVATTLTDGDEPEEGSTASEIPAEEEPVIEEESQEPPEAVLPDDYPLFRGCASSLMDHREVVGLVRALATVAEGRNRLGGLVAEVAPVALDRAAELVSTEVTREAKSLHTLARSLTALARHSKLRSPKLHAALTAATEAALSRSPRPLQALHLAAAKFSLERYADYIQEDDAKQKQQHHHHDVIGASSRYVKRSIRPATRLIRRLLETTQQALSNSINNISPPEEEEEDEEEEDQEQEEPPAAAAAAAAVEQQEEKEATATSSGGRS